jgi:hypothetical protein
MTQLEGGNHDLALADGGNLPVQIGAGSGTLGAGVLLFPNIAAMAAFDVTTLGANELTGVQAFTGNDTAALPSVHAYWSLDLLSQATVDGITIVACNPAPDGHGRWLRFASADPVLAVMQTAWEIDPVNGNDENSGIPGHPLKTIAERLRRIGTQKPHYTVGVTVTIDSDVPATDPWLETPTFDLIAGGSLTVVGVPTVAASVTLNAFTARNEAAATKDAIGTTHATGFWTPFLGHLCRDNTTPCYFWVNADGTNGTARVSAPMAFSTSTPAWVTPLVGDAVDVLTLPKLPLAIADALPVGCLFEFLLLDAAIAVPVRMTVANCSFTASTLYNATAGGQTSLANCNFEPSAAFVGLAIINGGQGRAGCNLTLFGVSNDVCSKVDGDWEMDGTLYVEGFHVVGAAGYFGTYADKTRQPFTVQLKTVGYGVARQWGTSAFNIAEGSQVGLGQSAVSSLLLTGAYTVDGAGTAVQYDPTTHAYLAAVAVTPTNIDAKGNLQNPVTGSRVFVLT